MMQPCLVHLHAHLFGGSKTAGASPCGQRDQHARPKRSACGWTRQGRTISSVPPCWPKMGSTAIFGWSKLRRLPLRRGRRDVSSVPPFGPSLHQRGAAKEMRCRWIRQGCIISLVPPFGPSLVPKRRGQRDEMQVVAPSLQCRPLTVSQCRPFDDRPSRPPCAAGEPGAAAGLSPGARAGAPRPHSCNPYGESLLQL